MLFLTVFLFELEIIGIPVQMLMKWWIEVKDGNCEALRVLDEIIGNIGERMIDK